MATTRKYATFKNAEEMIMHMIVANGHNGITTPCIAGGKRVKKSTRRTEVGENP